MNGVGGEKYASKNYPTTHLLRSRGAQLEIKFGELIYEKTVKNSLVQ